jgi:hypothetical protein
MVDPLNKGTATAPPILGEGCVQRYDPDALTAQDGTDFPGAAELWQATQRPETPPPAQPTDTDEGEPS